MHKKRMVPMGNVNVQQPPHSRRLFDFTGLGAKEFPAKKNRPNWDGIISVKAFFYQAKPVYFFKSSIELMST